MWSWVEQHQDRIDRWLDDEDEGESGKRIARAIRAAGLRACVKEKARREGFRPGDVTFYDRGVIRRALEVYLQSGITTEPPPDLRSGRTSDPAEGGNWTTTLLDVSHAYRKLPREAQGLLRLRYKDNWTERHIGIWCDLDRDQVHGRLERAITRMMDSLGGETPWTERMSTAPQHGPRDERQG